MAELRAQLKLIGAVWLFGLVLASTAAAQKIYKWVDEEGRTQYTQTPPPDQSITVQSSQMHHNEMTPERRAYCEQIRRIAGQLAAYRRQGLSINSALESVRQFEVSSDVDVDEIALRELVSFVYAGNRRRSVPASDIAGRAQDACVGGSFGKVGRGALAQAPTPDRPQSPAAPSSKRGMSSGTGWVTGGLIATNYHVIDGRERLRVRFADGTETSAFVSASDSDNDVALLRVGGDLPAGLPIAGAEAAIGADVFTLGFPHTQIMGNNAKLSTGIINSTTGMQDDPRLYQISVPVQSGNSGGPLINRQGEVVGLVTAKLSAAQVFRWTGDLPQNVNYAVKVEFLRRLLASSAGRAANLSAQPGSLEELAARVSPAVVLVIAE